MRYSLLLLTLICVLRIETRPLDDETAVSAESDEEKRSKLAGTKGHKAQVKVDVPPAPTLQTTAKPTNTKEKIIATTQAKTTVKATTEAAATTPKPSAGATTAAGTTAAGGSTVAATTAEAVTTPAVTTGAPPTTVGTTAAPVTTASVSKAAEKVAATKATKPTTPTEKPAVKPTEAKATTVPKVTKPGETAAKGAAKEEEKKVDAEKAKLVEEGDVENSPNNTKTMSATTFHIAIRFTKEKYTDDLQYDVNPVFQSMKKMVLIAIAKVFKMNPDFKQCHIIRFSDSEKPAGSGVVVDFYLRFYTAGNHLGPLSDQIKTGFLDTHPVSKKFVRAYPAEPKGRVCTPDCRVQCYSYCDQGCCNTMYHMQVQVPQQQSMLPPMIPATVPAPAPAPVPAPAPAPATALPPAPMPIPQAAPPPTFALPPAQPAPFPNYSPIAAPVTFASHCPQQCSAYCAPTCPNQCCQSNFQGPVNAAASPAYPVASVPQAGYAQYPQTYQAMGGCQQGMPGCG